MPERTYDETWTVYLSQITEEGPSPTELIDAGIKALGLVGQVVCVESDLTDSGWGEW